MTNTIDATIATIATAPIPDDDFIIDSCCDAFVVDDGVVFESSFDFVFINRSNVSTTNETSSVKAFFCLKM